LYAEAIRRINAAQKPVLAVDIPSGAYADATAPELGNLLCCADAVVTFTAPRPAHIFAGLTRGPTRVAPIGSPDDLIISSLGLELIVPRDFAAFLAPRDPEGHKGSYGHVLVLGGSVGKAGAAAMAGMASARMGAGLTTVGTARSALPMVAGFAPELMTEPLAEQEGSIFVAAQGDPGLDGIVAGKTVLAIGPGISRRPGAVRFVHSAVAAFRLPTVLDADGLNAFEGQAERLDGRERPLVLTPHPGEMSRLTGLSTHAVQADRTGVARQFARDHHCVLVLKGHRTLVALPG
jgi:NAD(P)H-hydrate epimerase